MKSPTFLPCALGVFVAAAGAAISPVCGASCIPPPADLISWWQAEGGAADTIGTNHGTLVGDANFTAGIGGAAFVFDGIGDAVDLGMAADLQLQDFTIEAWIQRADSTVTSLSHPFAACILCWSAGGYALGLKGNGELYLSKVEASDVGIATAVTNTDWHHVAVTKSGSTLVFYVDGVGRPGPAYDPGFVFNGPLAIGAAGSSLGASFYGAIDELAVYSRPLTGDEIQAIYNAGSAGKCITPSPPVLIHEPDSQVAHKSDDVTFTALALGTPPLAYQWYFNGAVLPGATNATLVLHNVQIDQAGNYSMEVTNDFGSASSTNALLTVNATFCTAPPASLVSWWRAENSGADAIGTNHGNLLGVTSVAGRVGAAFSFDGNDGVLLGNPASLQLQDFTIETWIKRASASLATQDGSGGGNLFCYGSSGYGLGLLNDGRLYLTKVQVSNVIATNALNDTNWHHIAVTKVASAVVFYVDGVGFPVAAYNPGFTFSTSVAIGARGDNLASGFFGLLDELSVYNRALTPIEIQAIYNAAADGKCVGAAQPYGPVPPYLFTQPASQTNTVWSSASFSVAAGGKPPLNYQWRFNGTAIPGATNFSLALTNVQMSQAGSYSVVVSNSDGSLPSSNAALTVIFPTAELRAASTNVVAGQSFALPLNLVANGTETALNFSLNFTPTRLSFAGIVPGSGAGGAVLMVDTNQLGSGRIGVMAVPPAQSTFAPGTQEVARVIFNSAFIVGGSAVGTTVGFGDLPVTRQLTNAAGQSLPANYVSGTVNLSASAFEGDVFPRTNGNQNISAADLDQVGRFVARLDIPAASGEFQRADCAPRSTLGDGQIKVTDWVQAGRMAMGLDALQTVGGPTAEVVSTNNPPPGAREVRAANVSAVQSVAVTIPVSLVAQGNEAALGFSLAFDPAKFTYVGASLGADSGMATLLANTSQAAAGRVGIALALPPGNNFNSGAREVAKLSLEPTTTAVGTNSVVFGDQPVPRSISNPNADELGATYFAATITGNGLPPLSIARAGTNVTLAWPTWAVGFVLQASTNLVVAGNWTNVVAGSQTNGADLLVTLPTMHDTRFFRLRHP